MQTPNEYDISRAFQRIENDLMDSMVRNLKRHRAEEDELGIKWEQWQALQLKELERYRAENADKFTGDFTKINRKIGDLYMNTYNTAQTDEENMILHDIIGRKFRPKQVKDTEFFALNDDKLNILLERTQADFTRAEYAVLRRADDAYRRVIFDAQVYANITNDYNKAVDMATHDFIKNGLQSIEYKNGARHNISDYARMAIRTGNKRAYLMGQGNARDKYGIHTVRVNRRTQACPLCVGYLGKVLVDDVYGGGTAQEASQLGVPTLSSAMQAGFLHPNCKDIYSMYVEGISQPAKPWTQEEIDEIVGEYNQEQALKHAQDMADSYTRLAKYALSPDNAQKYQARADNWQARVDEIKSTPAVPVAPNVASQATSEADKVRYNIERLKGEIADNRKAVASFEQFDRDHDIFVSYHDYASILGEDINTTLDNALDKAKDVYSQVPTELNKQSVERIERIKRDLAKHQDEDYIAGVKDKIIEADKDVEALRKSLYAEEEKLYKLSITDESLTETKMLQETVNGSKAMKDLVSYGTTNKVQYRTVNPLSNKLTEDEIIEKLAGGDMTSGSCVSLSCAFAGNINGYDVIDFRGGNSCKMFALNMNNKKLCDLPNVVAHKVTDYSAVKGANQLISDMVDDKLYILVTGKHASVVRKVNGVAQYLELQSANNSGWHNFEKSTLKNRFGCTRSRTVYGTKLQQLSYTIEIDSLYNNREFNNLLGYINTAVGEQKKGALGSVK